VELIFKNIEKLLAANDHAIVPGLGGFVIRHQPAQVEGNNILPPHITISFNPLMNQQDGLLALEISRTKGITYRKATEIINNKVIEFRNKLHVGKSLEFGCIGTFTMDENRNLIFNPSFCPPFIPFNLGLQKLSLPKQDKGRSKEIVIRLTRDQVMKYVAVLLAIFSLLLPPKVNKTTDVVQADFSKLILVNLPEITIESDIDANTDFAQQAHPDNQSQMKASRTYKVIVAAFYTKEKAQMVCNDLIKRNYPAEIVPRDNLNTISIRSFNDFSTAISFMEDLRMYSDEFSDAWVMRTASSSKN
jgi:nucleoid DNA-binding protein